MADPEPTVPPPEPDPTPTVSADVVAPTAEPLPEPPAMPPSEPEPDPTPTVIAPPIPIIVDTLVAVGDQVGVVEWVSGNGVMLVFEPLFRCVDGRPSRLIGICPPREVPVASASRFSA